MIRPQNHPMVLEVAGVPVYYAYDKINQEQVEYMDALLQSIDKTGISYIEIPSGIGKIPALVSTMVSYATSCKQQNKPFKIVHCAAEERERDEIRKELETHIALIKEMTGITIQGLILAEVEGLNRMKRTNTEPTNIKEHSNNKHPINTFETIKKESDESGDSLYDLMHKYIHTADYVVMSYDYLIDPAINPMVSPLITQKACVLFDNPTFLYSKCIESHSVLINRKTLEKSNEVIRILEQRDLSMAAWSKKETVGHIESISVPYYLHKTSNFHEPEHLPGNIRNPRHFICALKRLIECLKTKLKNSHSTSSITVAFIESITELTCIDRNQLRFCSQRLAILVGSANFDHPNLSCIKTVAKFATLCAIYQQGFSVVFEPFDSDEQAFNPVLKLCCLDSSIAIGHTFDRFRSSVLTSSVICSGGFYSRLFGVGSSNIFTIQLAGEHSPILPLVVTRGDDQMIIENKASLFDRLVNKPAEGEFQPKNKIDPTIIRNYGILLLHLSRAVPDNIVAFFPSHQFMSEVLSAWSETRFINDIMAHKAVFLETKNKEENKLTVEKYKKACDLGRGALLLSVMRGDCSIVKNLANGYGRCVVVFGLPFLNLQSAVVNEQLVYVKNTLGIDEREFLSFDAMKYVSESIAGICRNKRDYGLIVLADAQFMNEQILNYLPKWIKTKMGKHTMGLSIDMATNRAKEFYRDMAQPTDDKSICVLNHQDGADYAGKKNKL